MQRAAAAGGGPLARAAVPERDEPAAKNDSPVRSRCGESVKSRVRSRSQGSLPALVECIDHFFDRFYSFFIQVYRSQYDRYGGSDRYLGYARYGSDTIADPKRIFGYA